MKKTILAALALALAACATTKPPPAEPPPAEPPRMCSHPCDVKNGIEPARQVPCAAVDRLSAGCVLR